MAVCGDQRAPAAAAAAEAAAGLSNGAPDNRDDGPEHPRVRCGRGSGWQAAVAASVGGAAGQSRSNEELKGKGCKIKDDALRRK